MAIPSEISILFLYAKEIADACCAAFPTIGKIIVHRNGGGILTISAAFSISLTIISDKWAMNPHITIIHKIHEIRSTFGIMPLSLSVVLRF